ncbi:MAG: Fic family protein, partial [Acidobacteriota bacterium]
MADTVNTKTVVIEPEILDIIAELDEFKGAWRALSTLAPERLSALRRVATIESIGSSTRIEGSKLSDRDVEKLLSNVDIRSFETRDEQEVAGYAGVMETIFASWSVLPLTENHVRQLHRDLLRYSTKDERHRGEYKKLDNHVEAFDASGKSAGIVFQTASPFDTPRLMADLIEWTTEALSNRTLHPLLVIAIFVVVFLEIHPFQDGNGRLSRVLTTLLLLRAGYAYVPYSSLESVIERSKESYYLALRRTQKTTRSKKPDWQPWILFFLRALQQHKSRLESKVEREKKILGQLPEL